MERKFDFEGAFCQCNSHDQHPPHLVGFYHTVSLGTLQRFCRGIQGQDVEITVETEYHGNALTPSRYKGSYRTR